MTCWAPIRAIRVMSRPIWSETMKNTIYRWLTRYLSAVGLMLYVAEEGTVDLNVPHQATDEEVDELDKELGGTEQLKNPGNADGSDNAGDEIDDLTDEEQSTT